MRKSKMSEFGDHFYLIKNKYLKSIVPLWLNSLYVKQINRSDRNMFRGGDSLYILFVLSFMCFLYGPISGSPAAINVSLGFLTPLHHSYGPLRELGLELEAAFKLAIDAVNKDATYVKIRTDFSSSIKDEGENVEEACKKSADHFSSNQKYVGVVGAYFSACSVAFQNRIKELNSNIPLISYRSPSVELFDRTRYKSFYRISSNNKRQAEAIIDLINYFRWNQAAIIHTTEKYYGKELSDELVSRARNTGILIKGRITFDPDESSSKFKEKLQMIKTVGSRVNIIVAQGADVYKIIKLIKQKGMYGEGWVWILTDSASSLYFPNDVDVNETSQGFLGISPEMFSGAKFVSLIVQWYSSGFPGIINKINDEPTVSPFVGQIYRVVSLYHGLLTELVQEGQLKVTTKTSDIHKMLIKKMEGLTKPDKKLKVVLGDPIHFVNKMEDKPKFFIRNYLTNKFVSVGKWTPKINLYLSSIIWPGGVTQTPTDKGKPGKTLFQITFVAPTNNALGYLSEYAKELISAFSVALEIINTNDNYQIELNGLVKDEGFDGIESCERLANEIKDTSLVAVVGAFRSECSMKLHDVLNDTKIPIVSYGSTAVELSDKKKYPYFFRVVPPNMQESRILRQMINKYSLKEIGILSSKDLSSQGISLLFKELLSNDTTPIRIYEEFERNAGIDLLRSKVEAIRVSGARVIVLSALPNEARLIHQIAVELGMVGKGWIWFGADAATVLNFPGISNLAKSLEGMIGINPKKGEGSLYLQLLSLWSSKEKLKYPGIIHTSGSESLPFTAQVFDAVNGIALALTDLVSRKTITHLTESQDIRKHLYKELKNYDSNENGYISALGSKIYFDKNQDGPPQNDVVNLVDGEWLTIGKYRYPKQRVTFTKDPIFPGGTTLPLVGAGKTIFKVAAFFPKNRQLGPLADLGRLWESAFSAAVNWINRNDTITVGFDVSYFDVPSDPRNCSEVLKYLPANIDVIVGAARSECTTSIYREIHHYKIPMFTYASTSQVFSMKAIYPNLFRVCPPDTSQALALSDFIEKYSWDKVGIIAANDMYGRELADELENLLKEKQIRVTTRQFFQTGETSMIDQVEELKRAGSGVNLIIADPSDSLQIFQQAFELGMWDKGWTWLGSDGAVSTIFKRAQNLQRAMQGMVGFKPDGGFGELYNTLFHEWLRKSQEGSRETPYIAQVFDSILLPAHALHKLQVTKEITPMMSKLFVREKLLSYLKSMRNKENGFDSVTGRRLHFDIRLDVQPRIHDLVNLNGNNWVTVGHFEDSQLEITESVIWPGGTVNFPPSDQPIEQVPEREGSEGSSGTSKGLIVLAVVFSIFGLLVIIFMLYIVRRVRHRHLYMQSDLNQGGFFSVLYGHSVSRPGVRMMSDTNGHVKTEITASATDITGPMLPRHV